VAGELQPRQVAAKLVHRSRLNELALKTLRRALEVEIALAPHPNICQLLGAAWSSETAQVISVYEHCAGGTLQSALSNGSTQKWSELRKMHVAACIAGGLASLHRSFPPVMHRDLKPENILFGGGGATEGLGEPKIADFGEARHMHGSVNMMTQGRGTPFFSAPEQLSSRNYDVSVDVWAFGCVIACLWTDSEFPYPPEQVWAARRLLDRVMVGTIVPVLPVQTALHSFVRDCCQHEPKRRPRMAALEAQLSETVRMFWR
jgi:serine/threonine protein kinase